MFTYTPHLIHWLIIFLVSLPMISMAENWEHYALKRDTFEESWERFRSAKDEVSTYEITIDTVAIDTNGIEKLDLPYTTNNVIFQGKDGFIWIGAENGVYRFDGQDFKQFKGIDMRFVNFITEDDAGNIYFQNESGNWKTLKRAEKNNPDARGESKIPTQNSRSKEKNPRRALPILRKYNINSDHWIKDAENDRWLFATPDGILSIPVDTNIVDKNILRPLKAPREVIVEMLIDRSGALFVLTPHDLWVFRDRVFPSISKEFPGERVWEIDRLSNGNFAMVSNLGNKSLIREFHARTYRKKEGDQVDTFKIEVVRVDTFNHQLKTVIEAGSKLMALGAGARAHNIAAANRSITTFTGVSTDAEFNDIILIPGSDRYYLFANRESGLFYGQLGGKIDAVHLSAAISETAEQLKGAYEFKLLDDSTILVTGLESGLFLLPFKIDGNNKPIFEDLKRNTKIPANAITVAPSRRTGYWWVGTYTGGLFLIDVRKDSVIAHYSTAEGTMSNKVYSIAVTGQDVWFSTEKGMGCLLDVDDQGKGELISLAEHDGLPHHDGTGTSVYYYEDEDLLLLGWENGFTSFRTSQLKEEIQERLDRVKVRDKAGIPSNLDIWLKGSLQSLKFDSTNSMIYVLDETNLSIRFTHQDYLFQDLLIAHAAIKGEGMDTMIEIQPGEMMNLDLNMLLKGKPGKYSLALKTKTFGEWEDVTNRTITIIVQPPYADTAWKTIALITLLLASLLAIGIIALAWYTKKKRKTLHFVSKEFADYQAQGREEIKGLKEKLKDASIRIEESGLVNKQQKESHHALIGLVKELIDEIVKTAPSRKKAAQLFYKILYGEGIIQDSDIFGIAIKEDDDCYRLALYFRDGCWKEGTLKPLSDTGVGWVMSNGEELFIQDLEDEADWQHRGIRDLQNLDAGSRSMQLLPIKNGDFTYGVIIMESEQIKIFIEVHRTILRLLIESDLISKSSFCYPGRYFGEQIQVFREDWIIERPNTQPAHFGVERKREKHFIALDRLFEWDGDQTDEFFELCTEGLYAEDHPVNQVFKGMMIEPFTCPLASIIWIFAAAFERNKESSNLENPFLATWKSHYRQLDEDSLRYVDFSAMGTNQTVFFQAVYQVGELMFFRRDETGKTHSNIQQVCLRNGILEFAIALDDIKKFREKFERNSDGGSGGNSTGALRQVINATGLGRLQIQVGSNVQLKFLVAQ